MNKKITKGIIVPAVCLSILASTPGAIYAANFSDADMHWAKNAITIWADHGVIQGFDGLFRPDDTITRAEMAVMIDRIMNYQETAENTFEDLPESWYTEAVLKLVKQGVMQGHDNQIRPEDPVTREESLVMLARALGIEGTDSRAVSFTDSSNISGWAASAIQAMAERGFINGYEDGSFRPQDNMTRACSVTVINNAIKGFYNKPGTYNAEEEIDGIVIVNTPDVILEGMTINGDLIVTPGVQDGTVTLQGTTVSGQQIVMGGTVDSKPGTSNPGGDSDNGSDGDTDNGGTGNGGSNGGSGGITGGGGSGVSVAASTDIIVNSAYADETGRVIAGGKRYTIGENAFDTLEKAVAQAQTLNRKASITLMSDLHLEQTIALQADSLTLSGNGHTLSFDQGVKDGIQIINSTEVEIRDITVRMQDETNKWNGAYGIQAYQSEVTLRNVTATGADAAILVNGAEVALEGVVDVSGNEFGGIEVSKGAGVETMPKLTGNAENLKNDTELVSGKPTIWIDKVSELTSAVVAVSGLNEVSTEKDQLYFFLGQNPAEVTAYASNQQELEAALENADIQIIHITQDIASDKTLEVTHPVLLKGQDGMKTLTFENKNGMQLVHAGEVTLENIKIEVAGDEEGWQGLYALQVYGTTNATLKDVTATGTDGGILVNGAEVALEGVVDVSGNEFGGIEVSKGTGVETTPKLSGTAANLKNDTEEEGKPTVWIDKVSELTKDVVAVSGLNEGSTEKDQAHFYLAAPVIDTVDVSNLEELEKALENIDIRIINITQDIVSDKTLEVTRPVLLKGQDGMKTLTFENKNGMQLVHAGEVTLENIKIEVTGDEEGWQGLYALQVYGATNATLKDVTATGADGGILVNGAEVTLEGVVDVSGNAFGGIEVSKGTGVETTPKLSGMAANLKNETEEEGKPTVWIDKVSELTNAVVEVSGLNEGSIEKDQAHFYLGAAPTVTED